MAKILKVLVLAAAGLYSALTAAGGMTGVMVANPWVREAPPTAAALGGFMVLMNHTNKPAVLMGATSPAAEEVQLHRSVMEGGMMKMLHQHMIEIPANGQVEFKPGDYHLMLMKPKQVLKAGDKIEITLQFKDGTSLPATFEVRSGMGMDMGHGMQHNH